MYRSGPAPAPQRILGALLLTGLVALAACNGNDSPTAVPTTDVILTDVAVKADGQSLGGQTLHATNMQTGHVRFEARLMDRMGDPTPGGRVRIRYEIPGMGMMHRNGEFMLYDDGTHGDHMPGDGEYCYEDVMGEYGCHGSNRPMGPYQYDFCGFDEHGAEGNHMMLTVTLVP